jgi:hypothetical protein
MARDTVPRSPSRARPHLRVIANAPCPETEWVTQHVHEAVLAGEIVGVAVVCIQRNGDFFVVTAGRAKGEPVLTRGMLRSLDEHLSELARVQ